MEAGNWLLCFYKNIKHSSVTINFTKTVLKSRNRWTQRNLGQLQTILFGSKLLWYIGVARSTGSVLSYTAILTTAIKQWQLQQSFNGKAFLFILHLLLWSINIQPQLGNLGREWTIVFCITDYWFFFFYELQSYFWLMKMLIRVFDQLAVCK